MAFFDDFESYNAFSLDFEPWINCDYDYDDTIGLIEIYFEHNGSPMSFMVFDPSMTEPAIDGISGVEPLSGNQYLLCWQAMYTEINNNWLISPTIEIDDNCYVEFWARTLLYCDNAAQFRVGVSTDGRLPEDFTFYDDGQYQSVEGEWIRMHYDLSQYIGQEISIAIQSNYQGHRALMLDDFAIIKKAEISASNNEMIPEKMAIAGNYPNPFNPETRIDFYNSNDNKNVMLDIYNIKGQKVKTLINGKMAAGYHSVIWDGKDDAGNIVSSGVYFCRIESTGEIGTRKMMLLK